MGPLPNFTKKKKPIWRIVAAVVLFAIAAWVFTSHKSNSKQQAAKSVQVETGTIGDVITAQGKLEPKEYVDVGVQVTGQIKKLYVDVSDVVKKDQKLAEIDPRIYESRVAEDQANLTSLKAQADAQAATLVLAQRQHQRNADLLQQKAISKDAFDQTEAAYKEAAAKLNALKAQVDQAASQLSADQTNLGFTKIFAPMDGVIASLPVREGQTLNSVQSAPTLMQIANLDVMTVRAQVAEADIPSITLGMPAYFTTLGDMEHKWQGKVRLIQPSPEIINDVVLYNVLIDVENPEHKLMNGMSTQIFFEQGKAENIPVLPLDALGKRLPKEDNEAGKAYQVKMQNGDMRTVHVGLTDRTHAEIKDGVAAGDTVLMPVRGKPDSSANKTGGGGRMGGPRL